MTSTRWNVRVYSPTAFLISSSSSAGFCLTTSSSWLRFKKFAHVYYEDFNDEISDGRLDWNNENTKLFFSLMNHKFQITPRALLRTILYLRAEISYFHFRDSVAMVKPATFKALMKECVKYRLINSKAPWQLFFAERAGFELGIKVPRFVMWEMYSAAKKELELEQFDKDFLKNDGRIVESSVARITKATWESVLELANIEGLNLKEDFYVIAPDDHPRDSRLDRFFRNYMKYALIQNFGGHCANCESYQELELDHFWHPKSKGGNFAMRSKQGVYQNNCIPLCRSCNALQAF